MPFDSDDMSAFFDADMPGYAQATIGAVTVDGLFRRRANDAFGIVDAPERAFIAADGDLSQITIGSTIAIAGSNYTVAKIERGATGSTVAILK